jgi:hypothetical protein
MIRSFIFLVFLSASTGAYAGIIYHFEGDVISFHDYGSNILDDLSDSTFSGKIEYDASFLNSSHIYGADLIGDVLVGGYLFSTPADAAFIESNSGNIFVAMLPYNPVLILNSSYPTKSFIGDSTVRIDSNGYGTWSYNAYSSSDYSVQLSITGDIKPAIDVPEPSTLLLMCPLLLCCIRRFT